MKQLIAIIGTREPTMEQSEHLRQTLRTLDPEQVIICSGCADGTDINALSLAKELRFQTFAVLPWASYNREYHAGLTGIKTLDEAPDELQRTALCAVARLHGYPLALSKGAWALHARNYLIVHKASLVIAYPSPKGGGTQMGIDMGLDLNIPVTTIDSNGGVNNETIL